MNMMTSGEPITITASTTTNESPITNKASFTVIDTYNESTFELDKTNGITRVKWVGDVNAETAKRLLTKGGDSVEYDGYKKLMVDRYELKEFDTEARLWIKELFKTRAKRLSKNVEKMAIINPKTSMASVFSNMLTSAMSLIMPGLTIKKFSNREMGINWLLE